MNKGIIPILMLTFAVFSIAVASQETKAGSRTITVPDDYPSILAALENATDGDTVFVRNGTYNKHQLIIDKSISLVGEVNTTVIQSIDPAPPWDPGATTFPPSAPDAIIISTTNAKISGFTIVSSSKSISETGKGNQIVGNILTGTVVGIDAKGNETVIMENFIESSQITTSGWNQLIKENTLSRSFIDSGGFNSTIVGNKLGKSGINLNGNFAAVLNNTLKDSGINVSGSGNKVFANNISGGAQGLLLSAFPLNSDKYCGDNTVYKNTITHCKTGILILKAENNTFYGNFIMDNEIGISLSSNMTTGGNIQYLACYAFRNIFHHNNIVNNTVREAVDWSRQGTNSWDNGKEGNYWGDYNGVDSDGNGIGDYVYNVNSPYTITWEDHGIQPQTPNVVNNATDRYPLTLPYEISDIAIKPSESKNLNSTPAPSPSQTFSSSPENPTPLNSTVSQLSPLPTQSAKSPTTQQPEATTVCILVGFAGIATVIAGVAFFLRKHKKEHSVPRKSQFGKAIVLRTSFFRLTPPIHTSRNQDIFRGILV